MKTSLNPQSIEVGSITKEMLSEQVVTSLDTIPTLEQELTELSQKVNELDKGEAYIMGDTLTFRNYADASIEGETLKL